MAGFTFNRQNGSHRIYSKPGVLRPIVIQQRQEIDVFAIKANIRSAGITRDEYFQFFDKCK